MNNNFEKLALKKFKIKSILPDATILCLGKRRCLAKGTGVIMHDGNVKKIEDIKVGELVMGDDSTPRTVLSTTRGIDELYKVTHINTGDTYIVNSEHILSLKYENVKNDDISIKDISIKDISIKDISIKDISIKDISIKEYLSLPRIEKQKLLGYQSHINFKETITKIDPYIYGVIINKYIEIHKEYKFNSEYNRLKLLAGIIDAHGKLIDSDNNDSKFFQICFDTIVSDNLLKDIIYLIRSLGFLCTFTNNYVLNVIGSVHKIPCKIKKNILPLQNTLKQNILLSEIDVEKYKVGEYYGFELDGNHRFLLENFIVTHNSGKSWLVRDIFYHHRHIPSGVVFSGTEEASPFFSDFVPDCFIHSEYDPSLIESIMNRQKKKIKDAKVTGKSDTGKLASNNMFIVLDDMLHDAQNWKKDKTIKSIFFNGRHFNFLFILTMQYAQGIPPDLRSNIDYVFIFNEPSVSNRKKIYEAYAGMIPSFDHFCNILDACTQNHECLVIKTSGNSSDIRDQVFWYKAEPHKNFRVGHNKFWKYHKSNYNQDYEEQVEKDEEEVELLRKKFAKTRKLKVIVSRQGDVVGYKQE